MPLLALPFLVGTIGLFFLGTSDAAKTAANNVTGTTDQSKSLIPDWVIPTVLIGVGALLLYKEGAKLLKL